MSGANRVVKILGTLALVAVVLPFAVVGGANVVDGYSSHVVVSGSMEPAIGVGDVVIIDHSPGEIRQGDVITYGSGDDRLPTTHRVVDIRSQEGQETYVTKGDANEDRDPTPVQRQQVVGEVFLTVPYIGHVLTFADTTYGFAVLVVVPIGLLLLNEAWVLFRSARDSDGDKPDDSEEGDSDNGASPASAGDADDGGETITLTAKEIQLALVPTAALTVVSAWITYDTRSGVAAAITTAAGVSLLFGFGMVVTSSGPTDEIETASQDESDSLNLVGEGESPLEITTPVTVDDERLVPVESVETIVACAEDMERCLLWDPAESECYLPNGDHLYRCQSVNESVAETLSGLAPEGEEAAASTTGADGQSDVPENGSSMQDNAEAVEYQLEEGPDDT
ncbi:signal peptidase I [Halomicroarcula sp. F13]|uniref:Signal peptidase I n=1 Tax=Haloarcula rubra TaxID=2487747 RepID=A0AAW4PUM4_9EURY|nr:signal peptidase I [Halomicroarcula rubra]MBX0324339.1 signal peptidase I [Halomicroarcula rubra]